VTIEPIWAHFPDVRAGGGREGAVTFIICPMHVLVTGASGFAGSLLVPRLRSEGHAVRALARDPERVARALARSRAENERSGSAELEVVRGDAVTGAGLAAALEGIDVAYYLIHSMESTPVDSTFAERDRLAAENFATEAKRSGVSRIVYLGGLVPRWRNGGAARSLHLASREKVERVLLAAVPDSVALRASIVIGTHSRSFRLLVRLVERLPVLTLPAWQRFRTQPVDARDVTEMLLASAHAQVGGRALEIGGPDVLTYGQMMRRIAELMLVSRPTLRLGVNLTAITSRVAAAIAGEDPELVVPLMHGLQGDLLPADDRAAERLGVRLHSFDAAVEHALREWERLEPLAAR
jgi:uncharacterized protein YbjT (DUF2867 family)